MDGEGVEWPGGAASLVRVKRGKCKPDSPAVEEARLASKQARKQGSKEAPLRGRNLQFLHRSCWGHHGVARICHKPGPQAANIQRTHPTVGNPSQSKL